MSLLNDLSIDNLEVLNEFDVNGFIDISSFALGKDNETSHITFSTDKYKETLIKAINNINDATLDYTINRVLDEIYKFNIRANEIDSSEIITFNTRHLDSYVETIAKMLDGVYKNEIDKEQVDKITSSQALDALKRNSVKTSFEQPNVIKLFKFHKDNEFKVVNVDNSYVRRRIVPFIDNYNSKRADLMNELGDVAKQMDKASDRTKTIISTMNKIKAESTDAATKEKLTYAMYYGLRNIIEVISYITAMAVHKAELFVKNTMICNEIVSQVENRSDILNESYGAHVGVVPTDEESMSDSLRNGDISAFKILASNIYGLHINTLKNPDVPEGADETGESPDGEFLQGYIKYKKDVYDNIIKDIIEVGQGVDFLTGRIDQFIMVTDDIVNNAGFVMSLFDRYASDLNAIEDLSNYSNIINLHPQGDMINGLYQTALAEVHDYESNMQNIANTVQECYTRLQALRSLLTTEHNGEFNTSEPMIELKDWLDNFTDEFGKFTGTIGVKFLSRLKSLGETINEIKLQEERPTENTGDELDIDAEESSVDFVEMAYESIYDDIMLEHQFTTHILELEFYKDKAALNGNILFTEADVPQANTATATNGQPKVNTTPKAFDPQSGSNFINKIIESIGKWFNKVREIFVAKNKNLTASKNGKLVASNISQITSRDYTNATLTMLPYDAMDGDKAAIAGLQALTNEINKITPQSIQNVKSKEDLYKVLFTNNVIRGGIDKNLSLADQIKNYYKTGSTSAVSTKVFSGNELKAFITSKMAPYVVNYDNSISNSVNDACADMEKALNDKIKSLSTVQPTTIPSNATPAVESVMTEALLNPNTTVSMGKKGNFISYLCKVYTGAIYNALTDRYRDYVKGLSQFIPKENEQPQQQPQEQVDNTDFTANANNEQPTT